MPESPFPPRRSPSGSGALEGLEDTLADAVVGLWARDAASLNDTVLALE